MAVTKAGGGASRTAVGCLVYILVAALLGWGIEQAFGARMEPVLRPWVALAAALNFTLALGALQGWLASFRAGGESRAAVLARAARGELPPSDGVVIVTGTVKPASGALRSPITDTPCVAYCYRIWEEVVDPGAAGRRGEEPHYWGHACRPFVVQTATRAVRVMAVPQLLDPPQRCASAEHIERARRWVRATRFEAARGPVGALRSVLAITDSLLADDDGEARRDWSRASGAADPGTLNIEEVVVPLGAQVSVAGAWSAQRNVILPRADSDWARGVQLASGPLDALLRHAPVMPPSRTSALLFALVLGALGAGVIGLAIHLPDLAAGY